MGLLALGRRASANACRRLASCGCAFGSRGRHGGRGRRYQFDVGLGSLSGRPGCGTRRRLERPARPRGFACSEWHRGRGRSRSSDDWARQHGFRGLCSDLSSPCSRCDAGNARTRGRDGRRLRHGCAGNHLARYRHRRPSDRMSAGECRRRHCSDRARPLAVTIDDVARWPAIGVRHRVNVDGRIAHIHGGEIVAARSVRRPIDLAGRQRKPRNARS